MSGEIELRVSAAEGVTDRYAKASGDHNPIHLDEAFAESVGLPGRILHGLWMAAQVARAATSAAPDGPLVPSTGATGEAQYALASLAVSFRGMGRIGPELVVSGTSQAAGDGSTEVTLSAHQEGNRLIRNARASLRSASIES